MENRNTPQEAPGALALEERPPEGVDLRRYLWILWVRLPVVAITFFVVIAGAAFWTYTLPNVYEATSKVRMEKAEQPRVAAGQGILVIPTPSTPSVETCIQLMKSRPYLEEALNYIRQKTKGRISPPLEGLRRAFKVEPIENTDILKITARAYNPEEAKWIADAVAYVFVKKDEERRKASARRTREYIEELLYGNPKKGIKGVRERLREIEEKVRKFSERERILSEDDLARYLDQWADLRAKLEALDASIVAAEERIKYLRSLLKRQGGAGLESGSSAIDALRTKLVDLEMQLIGLRQQYQEEHPKVAALRAQVEEIRRRLREAVRRTVAGESADIAPTVQQLVAAVADLATYRAQREAYARWLSDLERRIATLPKKAQEFARLRMEKQITEQLYSSLLQRLQEARIAEAGRVAGAYIVETATVPTAPIEPNRKRNLIFGFVIALAMSVGLGFLVEYLDDTVKMPEDIEARLGVPLFGMIPLIEAEGKYPLVLVSQPRSSASEAFRSLRSAVKFAGADGPLKTLLITSPGPNEGKTLVAANLAMAFAQAGSRVILLDCDLRHPALHRYFGVQREKGLTNYLVGEASLDEIVKGTGVSNLWLVPAGTLPPNPPELLESEAMRRTLEALSGRADIVIVDSPPLLGVADATILSSICDGTLLIAEAGSTRREAISLAKKAIDAAHGRVIGAVLNKVGPRRGGYYYYYRYYYRYYYKYYGPSERRR